MSGRVTRLGRTGRSASMAAPRTLAPIRAGGGTVHRLSPRRCGTPLAVFGRLARGRLSCDAWAEVVAEGIVTVAIRPCPDPALTLLLAPARPTMRGSQ